MANAKDCLYVVSGVTSANTAAVLRDVRLCSVRCSRENPDANAKGKGRKKAPPRGGGWDQSTALLLGAAAQCQELQAEELLTFPFICASPRVAVKCERAAGLDADERSSEGKASSKRRPPCAR